jgi:hypothetical protein
VRSYSKWDREAYIDRAGGVEEAERRRKALIARQSGGPELSSVFIVITQHSSTTTDDQHVVSAVVPGDGHAIGSAPFEVPVGIGEFGRGHSRGR